MSTVTPIPQGAIAPRTPTRQLVELVNRGIESRREAERRHYPFIFVTEIYRGASRISSQIEFNSSVSKLLVQLARDDGRAFCLLARADDGEWSIADYGDCLGDNIQVRP